MKKISLVMPVYNTVEYLEKCIRRVLEQTYNNIDKRDRYRAFGFLWDKLYMSNELWHKGINELIGV